MKSDEVLSDGGWVGALGATHLMAAMPVFGQSAGGPAATNAALDVYAVPQHLVRIGHGRNMNVYCQGSGSPTVILEAGAGGSTLGWHWVEAGIARTTRICSYDRAGMGFSDPGPLPRTAAAVVEDFATLMQVAKIQPPYVLVSHSLGSYFVHLYADRHPQDVVGMVLLVADLNPTDSRRLICTCAR